MITILAIVVRSAVTLAFLVLMMRLSGKRDWRLIRPLDIMTAIVIGNLGGAMVIGSVSLPVGIIGTGMVAWCHLAITLLIRRSPRWRDRLLGQPVTLVRDGRMLRPIMQLEHIDYTQLEAILHNAGVERLRDVKEMQLDPDGQPRIVLYQDVCRIASHELGLLNDSPPREESSWKRAA